jgi:hypothetical protein
MLVYPDLPAAPVDQPVALRLAYRVLRMGAAASRSVAAGGKPVTKKPQGVAQRGCTQALA